MNRIILPLLTAATGFLAQATAPTLTPANGYPKFALGADVSWTSYIEENNVYTYYKEDVVTPDQITCVSDMLHDYGIDAVRLRVWVDPTAPMALSGFSFVDEYGYKYDEMSTFGTCSVDEMTALAIRCAARGQRIMVVFQMSDQWADPARQFIPASWSGCTDVDQLTDKAVAHVKEVLTILHDNNVNVAWVQIGNETNNGMLEWQLPNKSGEAVKNVHFGCKVAQTSANMPSETTRNFVKVFNACSDAAKDIYPETKTVMHLTKTAEWTTINWSLGLLVKAGLSKDKCDYIGLSLYPGIDDGQEDYTSKWQKYADLGIETIDNIYDNYGFRTILAEIGMNNEYSLSANVNGLASDQLQAAYIRQCNSDVEAFTQYLIENLSGDNSTCDGLFYWEPETDYMKGYKKGACVSTTPGASWPRTNVTANDWWYTIRDFSTFPDGGLIPYIVGDTESCIDITIDEDNAEYFNTQGMFITHPISGIYVKRQGKVAKKVIF